MKEATALLLIVFFLAWILAAIIIVANRFEKLLKGMKGRLDEISGQLEKMSWKER